MSLLQRELTLLLALMITAGSTWAMLVRQPMAAIFILLLGIFLMLIQIFVAIKTRET